MTIEHVAATGHAATPNGRASSTAAAATSGPDRAAPAGPLVVIADGVPEGQGRISYNKAGYGYYTNGTALKAWRATVRNAALQLYGLHEWAGMKKLPCRTCGIPKLSHAVYPYQPIKVDIVCVFPPIASAPGRLYPTKRSASDWDHLGRAIGDALSGVLYVADAQVVAGRVRALYTTHPAAPLGDPGALIWVSTVDDTPF